MYVVLSILLVIFALKDHYLNGGSINRKPECNEETKMETATNLHFESQICGNVF